MNRAINGKYAKKRVNIVMVGSPKLKRELNQPAPNAFILVLKLLNVVVQVETPPVLASNAPAPLPKAASVAAVVAAVVAVDLAPCKAVPADLAAPCRDDVIDEKTEGFAGAGVADLLPDPIFEGNDDILLSS